MKKILLLIILLFSTGCTINYNLTIDESNNYIEEVALTSYETIDNPKEALYALYEEEYPIYIDQEFAYYNPYLKLEDFEYYEKSFTELETGYIFNYKSNYEQSTFSRARSLNTVYKNSNIGYLRDTDTYYISASNPIIFVNNTQIEQISINITFNNWDITNHNADQINNNTYTWILTRDNNKSININYKEKEKVTPPAVEQPGEGTIIIEPESSNNIVYILMGIFGLIIIIILSISIKKKRL